MESAPFEEVAKPVTYSPSFRITNAITTNLTKIERARGFLDAAKLSEDWIAGMAREALVAEAHSTTHIEGSQLTLEQAETLLAGKPVPEADPDDVTELLNYKTAFDLVADHQSGGGPITEEMILRIHACLVEGVRGNMASPGKYRGTQNYVVNSVTGDVIYTPPAPDKVPALMADLVDWLQAEDETPPVLAAGIAQFQLVHIHPFRDGNGRTARLLSTLCLYGAGYDFKRLLSISEYYDRDRPAYYGKIRQAEDLDLDLTHWLEYFTEGLASQMRDVQVRGEKAIRRDVVLSRAECTAAAVVDRRTVQRYLKLLVDKGFVREVGRSPTDPTKYYEPGE